MDTNKQPSFHRRKRPGIGKRLLQLCCWILGIHILACILLYFFQEKLIFFPQKLEANFNYTFQQPFEELQIATADGDKLNGLLFKAPQSKGLIFYLHGNAGSLQYWGELAPVYTAMGYDVFMPDYRGYGKSEGRISSQQQLYADVQTAYNQMKARYAEDSIVVLGYSIGTGLAAHLAADNHPRLLILQAPYYSLQDLVKHKLPMVPSFILRYKLDTHNDLKRCRMPVAIFHGDQDEVIYYGSSRKLQQEFKRGDTLIRLHDGQHNGMSAHPDYLPAFRAIVDSRLPDSK